MRLMRAIQLQGTQPVLTVRELNAMVRGLLESNLPLLWVAGEVSNFTRAASGHWYFSLKDAQAQVRCVMFRQRSALLDFVPHNGMQIEVRALPTLYEARGDFQLGVEALRKAGLGALYEAFERLKKQLEAEGLFDVARKKSLPAFPRTVGIVTSPAGAALRDVLTTLARRMPGIKVILYPTLVQGDGAAVQLVTAVQTASLRNECDVLIICRGGGSLEDLWSFNDEALARAVARCAIPVVSGVGHETDFTIVDFVADVRAPTPTAAAELVSPDQVVLQQRLTLLDRRIGQQMGRHIDACMQRLDYLGRRLVHPGERIRIQGEQVGALVQRAGLAMRKILEQAEWQVGAVSGRLMRAGPRLGEMTVKSHSLATRLVAAGSMQMTGKISALARLATGLEHLNPEAVLERGYSLALNTDGQIVRDSGQLTTGDALHLRFAHGMAAVEVKDTSD
jgi:exodeoxyribonuclease VII large subunit